MPHNYDKFTPAALRTRFAYAAAQQVDIKARNGIALAMLLFGKMAGIAGLVVGVTDYRVVGAMLLALDGALLSGAVVMALQNMRAQRAEELDQKQVLEKMVREGTLDQFLRDLRESGRVPESVRPPRAS